MQHLNDIDAALLVATNALERERLRAERICVLARMGRLDEARLALAGLRAQLPRHRSDELAAWAAFAAAMLHHVEADCVPACAHFEQAKALAASAGADALVRLAGAWHAASLFNQGDLPAAVVALAQVLPSVQAGDHAAQLRTALTLGDLFVHSGDVSAGQVWYLRARQAARQLGDASLLSTVLYNMAALRVSAVALADALDEPVQDAARRLLLEVESITHYDGGLGTLVAVNYVPLMRAQLLLVLQQWSDALALYRGYVAAQAPRGTLHAMSRLTAEHAWCLWHSNAQGDALIAADALARRLSQNNGSLRDDDDQAAAHARLAQLFRLAERSSDAAAHQAQCDAALTRYRAQQAQTRELLAPFV